MCVCVCVVKEEEIIKIDIKLNAQYTVRLILKVIQMPLTPTLLYTVYTTFPINVSYIF